ncbi:hypothetical protein EUX98_g8596 [Antrodiella citrinella]|uniref:Uncharacterized protein n=1 Tax=Antrodiella citrinella TaxID=2447956 RepID=A0A4S4M6M7_9APHY|nr:hypothetical protein EUX98_g8596 [Antrodiella citrinella]
MYLFMDWKLVSASADPKSKPSKLDYRAGLFYYDDGTNEMKM